MAEPLLSELPFVDLYVRLDADDQPLYRARDHKDKVRSQLVPPAFFPAIQRFAKAVKMIMTATDGSIEFDGVRCRLSLQKMADNTTWVCARQINTFVPELKGLHIAPHICEHLHKLGQRDGLILISGATGNGKTTTAVALLVDYLRSYGGTAITIEDPVEFTIKGRHGDGGHCFQVEVLDDDDWALHLKRSLRWSPRYIFVGEIRTPQAAEQILRAATTGHMVISTVHAGSPEEALLGLLFLAEQSMGAGAKNALAAGLTALLFQQLQSSGPFLRYLYTEENAPGDPIRGLIREGKIGMISTYIDRVAARLTARSGSSSI